MRLSTPLFCVASSIPWLVPAAAAVAQLPLGPPELANVATVGDQEGSRVAMADDGRFRVFWVDRNVNSGDVKQRLFSASGVPSSPSTLNEFLSGIQDGVEASMNGAGDWIVAWESTNQVPASGQQIYARRSGNSGSTLASEFLVTSDTSTEADDAVVARGEEGSYVIGWKADADPTAVLLRQFAPDGDPETDEVEANESPAEDGSARSVAIGPGGTLIAGWTGTDDLQRAALIRLLDADGEPLGEETPVHEEAVGDQQSPRVAVDARGAFVVVWREGLSNGRFKFRLFHPDGSPRSPERFLDSDIGGSRFSARVDMARDGAFVVSMDGTMLESDRSVLVREFTKSGLPVGEPFAPAIDPDLDQLSGSVGVGDRLFVVAWSDQESSVSSADDVLVRRYVRRVVFTDDFESGDLFYWGD